MPKVLSWCYKNIAYSNDQNNNDIVIQFLLYVSQYCEDIYDHVVIAMMDVKARYYLLKLLEEFGRSLAAHRELIGHSKVCTTIGYGVYSKQKRWCSFLKAVE